MLRFREDNGMNH